MEPSIAATSPTAYTNAMKLETLLPLGKVDPGLRAPEEGLDISAVADSARLLEEIGYTGLITEETKDDPFVIMALAAQATSTLRLGTGVAIAFPRSPTVTAMSAWTLQKLSKGRFTLGLGTQVRGHIVRRYGMQWSPPGPWLQEYIEALRAIWHCWQSGESLDFQGQHYNLNLMVPLFNPGPIDFPQIPIHLAAVKPVLSRISGAVADGLRPHPVCTPSYIKDVMFPAVRKGASQSGRSLKQFDVCMKPLVATAATDTELAQKIEDARARIAFYASTPAYAVAFEHLGLDALAKDAQGLSKSQDWDALPGLISDAVLEKFAVIGTYKDIADRLIDRWADTVTHIEFSIAVNNEEDRRALQSIADKLQTTSEETARKTIDSRV